MILYTGFRKDGFGWEIGYYGRHLQPDGSYLYFIQNMEDNKCYSVHPESLGMIDTNVKDVNKKFIVASFPYEKGKMSKGGSIVNRRWFGKKVGCMIFFRSGRFSLRPKIKYKPVLYTWAPCDYIVGNAYSNPELLGKYKIELEEADV